MAAVQKVLIIGGGFAGMSAAILLRRAAIDVDLVEIDAGWRSYGAGITINGASLRALGVVGVLRDVVVQGYCADSVALCAADGRQLALLPTPRLAGSDVPGGGGIMRPILARILAEATRAAGARVRLGCSFTQIVVRDDEVEVRFTDHTTARYDLVIGADGLSSAVRKQLFPASPAPRYTGQGVWRAVLPRPASLTHPIMFLGAHLKVGFNPVSQSEMYSFLTEDRVSKTYIEEEQLLPQFSELLGEFPAPLVVEARRQLGPQSRIVYRPLESLLVPAPWHRGRVLLIGDAAHATTPHLAAGAGMGIEDAIVIAEELQSHGSIARSLEQFQKRRFERCRLVVENSVRLGEIERTGGSQEEHARLMRESMMALAGPI